MPDLLPSAHLVGVVVPETRYDGVDGVCCGSSCGCYCSLIPVDCAACVDVVAAVAAGVAVGHLWSSGGCSSSCCCRWPVGLHEWESSVVASGSLLTRMEKL